MGLLGFLFSKKHYQKKDIESMGLDNIRKGIGIYNEMIEDLKRQLQNQEDYYEREIQKMQHRLDRLEEKRRIEKKHWEVKIADIKKIIPK